MDGRAWPAGHKMWDIWYPPNGYRCRCSVIALTAGQAQRRGIKVETEDPTYTLIEPIDPLTGNRMPARQLIPDVGFNSNPGKVVYPDLGDLKTKEDELLAKLKGWKAPATANLFPGVADRRLRKMAQDAFAGTRAEAVAMAGRYGSVKLTKARTKGSTFHNGEIRLGTAARKGGRFASVFRHEFGHQIDHASGQELAKLGMDRKWYWRSEMDDFADAFRADAAAVLDAGVRQAALEQLIAERDARYFDHPSISDLFDALTNKRIHGRWGHEAKYYRIRGFGGRTKQVFANLFDLYAVGGEDWGFVQKELPRVAAVFEVIMGELATK